MTSFPPGRADAIAPSQAPASVETATSPRGPHSAKSHRLFLPSDRARYGPHHLSCEPECPAGEAAARRAPRPPSPPTRSYTGSTAAGVTAPFPPGRLAAADGVRQKPPTKLPTHPLKIRPPRGRPPSPSAPPCAAKSLMVTAPSMRHRAGPAPSPATPSALPEKLANHTTARELHRRAASVPFPLCLSATRCAPSVQLHHRPPTLHRRLSYRNLPASAPQIARSAALPAPHPRLPAPVPRRCSSVRGRTRSIGGRALMACHLPPRRSAPR